MDKDYLLYLYYKGFLLIKYTDPQTLNLYEYADDNPVSNVDPNGTAYLVAEQNPYPWWSWQGLQWSMQHSMILGDFSAGDVTSLINESNSLIKAAEQAGSDQAVQREIDNLIQQYLSGNENPGMGTKHLVDDIFYLRGSNGARVFFRDANGVFEILGKASKANENQVINFISVA